MDHLVPRLIHRCTNGTDAAGDSRIQSKFVWEKTKSHMNPLQMIVWYIGLLLGYLYILYSALWTAFVLSVFPFFK